MSLHTDGASITIWTGWWSQNTLLRVTPRFNNDNADLLPQNCNAVGSRVVGAEVGSMLGCGQRVAARSAARLAPLAWQGYKDAYADDSQPFDESTLSSNIALEYVAALPNSQRALEAASANRFSKPNVGEAYLIATMGGGAQQANGTTRVRDHATNTDRDLGWSFHFAGVVARSGADRVTLENYALGDNRQNGADPRWYFQMSGGGRIGGRRDDIRARLAKAACEFRTTRQISPAVLAQPPNSTGQYPCLNVPLEMFNFRESRN